MAGIEFYKEYIETAGPLIDSSTVTDFVRTVLSDKDSRTVICTSPENREDWSILLWTRFQ